MNVREDITDEMVDGWQTAYESGQSLNDLSLLCGIPISTIRYRLVNRGMKLAPPNTPRNKERSGNRLTARQRREMWSLLFQGKPVPEIARILGISPTTVYAHKYKAMMHG